jgi:hypothetical protein
LDAQHSIHTPLGNPLTPQNLTVFNTTHYKLVLILEIKFVDLCSDGLFIVWVGVDGVYEVYDGWVIAVELIAWAGAEIENFALSGADKGRDAGGVFIGDEAVGCARALVYRELNRGQGTYRL